MNKRILPKTPVASSSRSFTGKRQPVHPMPQTISEKLHSWCKLNGIFMSEDDKYIIWNHTDFNTGKSKLIKLFLTHHKSTMTGKHHVFARNMKYGEIVNLSRLMAIEQEIAEIVQGKDLLHDHLYTK